MTLPRGWLVNLNKRRFRFEPPREDPVEYSRWEFGEGRRVWQRFFARKVNLTGKDVLDLGCGPGGKTCYLATLKPHRVVGVDFASELIHKAELAREVLPPPEDRVRLEFVCVNAADLPFPDEYFDVITCSDAFEHFAEPGVVLSEAARVLKSGGVFALDFAQWGSYNGHHLGDFIATGWAHVFWSEADVSQAVVEIVKNERDRLTDIGAREKLDDLVRRRLDHFHSSLNRMSLGTFERYLQEEKKLKVRWSRRTSAHPLLWPLTVVPGIRELVVARNVYILERLP